MNEDYLVGEMVDNQIKAAKEDRAECPYCGGTCPEDDMSGACDGFLGDIDGLLGGEYECVGGCDGFLIFPCALCVFHTPERMAEFNKMLKGLMPLDNPADCVVQLAPEREESANG